MSSFAWTVYLKKRDLLKSPSELKRNFNLKNNPLGIMWFNTMKIALQITKISFLDNSDMQTKPNKNNQHIIKITLFATVLVDTSMKFYIKQNIASKFTYHTIITSECASLNPNEFACNTRINYSLEDYLYKNYEIWYCCQWDTNLPKFKGCAEKQLQASIRSLTMRNTYHIDYERTRYEKYQHFNWKHLQPFF